MVMQSAVSVTSSCGPSVSVRSPVLLTLHSTDHLSHGIAHLVSRKLDLGRGQGAGESELRGDSLDPVGGVEVLDQRDLVACGAALTRDDGGIGQKELPDLE